MKEKWTVLVAIVSTLAAFAAEANAMPQGSIVINPAPTVGAGSITAKGDYENVNGWAPGAVQLQVLPMNGGLQATATAAAPPSCNVWGPITVSNLSPGSYAVYALMNLTQGNNTNTVCSSVAVVMVVDSGGAPPVPVGTVKYAQGDPNNNKAAPFPCRGMEFIRSLMMATPPLLVAWP